MINDVNSISKQSFLTPTTEVEKFSVVSGLTKKIHALNQSPKYSQQLAARIMGFSLMVFAILADVIAHATLAIGKAAIIPFALPFSCGNQLPKDLSISSPIIHLVQTIHSLSYVIFLPLLCLVDPSRAYQITSGKESALKLQKKSLEEKYSQWQEQLKDQQSEISRLTQEIKRLEQDKQSNAEQNNRSQGEKDSGIQKLNDELTKLKQENQTQKTLAEDLQKQINTLNVENQKILREKQTISSEVDRTKKLLTDAENTEQNKSRQISRLTQENARLKQQSENSDQELTSLRALRTEFISESMTTTTKFLKTIESIVLLTKEAKNINNLAQEIYHLLESDCLSKNQQVPESLAQLKSCLVVHEGLLNQIDKVPTAAEKKQLDETSLQLRNYILIAVHDKIQESIRTLNFENLPKNNAKEDKQNLVAVLRKVFGDHQEFITKFVELNVPNFSEAECQENKEKLKKLISSEHLNKAKDLVDMIHQFLSHAKLTDVRNVNHENVLRIKNIVTYLKAIEEAVDGSGENFCILFVNENRVVQRTNSQQSREIGLQLIHLIEAMIQDPSKIETLNYDSVLKCLAVLESLDIYRDDIETLKDQLDAKQLVEQENHRAIEAKKAEDAKRLEEQKQAKKVQRSQAVYA